MSRPEEWLLLIIRFFFGHETVSLKYKQLATMYNDMYNLFWNISKMFWDCRGLKVSGFDWESFF